MKRILTGLRRWSEGHALLENAAPIRNIGKAVFLSLYIQVAREGGDSLTLWVTLRAISRVDRLRCQLHAPTALPWRTLSLHTRDLFALSSSYLYHVRSRRLALCTMCRLPGFASSGLGQHCESYGACGAMRKHSLLTDPASMLPSPEDVTLPFVTARSRSLFSPVQVISTCTACLSVLCFSSSLGMLQ